MSIGKRPMLVLACRHVPTMRGMFFLLPLIMTTTTTMSAGKLQLLGPVSSRHLESARSVQVYLPPSYESDPEARYPVLYLHDGQNVFSSAGPDCCFGWGNWDLDHTVDRLIEEGRMREIIMVAIDNSRSRYREYRGRLYTRSEAPRRKPRANAGSPPSTGSGQAPAEPTPALDNVRFDAYARFIIDELKPQIDRDFRTLPTPATTGAMGSSLGGICSLALAWEFPKTFGLAASLSGAFQVEKTNFLREALAPYQGKRKPVRIYLDSGIIDYTGDDDGRKHTDAVAAELRRIGWEDGLTLQHYTDLHPLTDEELAQTGLPRHKWGEAHTSQHNEFYWRWRAWRALIFLFPAEPPAVNRFRPKAP